MPKCNKNHTKIKSDRLLGRVNEEFYKNINFDKFKSKEEIISFVEENNNLLQLIEDENGEIELETKLYNNSNRYFLNNDKMFQIENLVYKVLESGTIVTNYKNLYILKNAGDQINSLIHDNRFAYVPNNVSTSKNLKSTNGDCGTSHIWRNTSGNNRLKVEISVKDYDGLFGTYNGIKCHFISRPYKKTLGVWYWCSRTMKADVYIEYETEVITNPETHVIIGSNIIALDYYHDWENTSKFEIEDRAGDEGGDGAFFFNYDVWVDTKSVSPVDQECSEPGSL